MEEATEIENNGVISDVVLDGGSPVVIPYYRIFGLKFPKEVLEKRILIIIPTYNEHESICPLLTLIIETVPSVHMLVVDDMSPDGTGDVVKAFMADGNDDVFLLEREGPRGLGNAYRAGLQYGLDNGYEILITMDADWSHNPLHLPEMLAEIENADVVVGSRYMRDGGTINWRIRRILLSWLANRFARFVLKIKGSDLTSGFRAYRREVLESIGLENVQSDGYSYLVEMLYRAQLKNARVGEVPILFFDRTMGRSKINRKEIYRGAFTLIRLRFKKGKIKKQQEKI